MRSGDDDYAVAKILKLEPGVVHVRVYAKRYPKRPRDVADDELYLGTAYDEEFGLGHLPFDANAFAEWKPEVIRHTTVAPEELEGYEIWREAEAEVEGSGGVWGRRESLLTRIGRLFRRPQ